MAPNQAAPVPAGWYPDPYKAAELRWWDGQNWTDSIHPPPAPAPVAPPAPAPPVSEEPVVAPPVEPIPEPFAAPSAVDPTEAAPVQANPATESTPQETAPVDAPQQHEAQAQAQVQVQAQAAPPVEEHTPAPEFMIPPSTPPLVEPPAVVAPDPTPLTSAALPAAEAPVVAPQEQQATTNPLPSRRELRARAGGVAESTTSAPIPLLSPEPAIPDSATPTAFDWLNTGSGAPLGVSQTASTPTSPAAPVSNEPAQNPLTTSPTSGATNPFSQGDNSPEPVAASSAWAQEPEPSASVLEQQFSSEPTRKSTLSGWLIALTPLIGSFLVVGGIKGAENYPRYVPANIDWWMLAGAIIAVVYLATVILAIADRGKLDWSGYNQPAHWAWAILTAPVYLLMRMIAVKRETGRNSVLIWVWLALALAVGGAWYAAATFAPELIEGYTLPFL